MAATYIFGYRTAMLVAAPGLSMRQLTLERRLRHGWLMGVGIVPP